MSDAALDPRVSHLLSLAKTIRHYKEALSQANGERFNLFDILHVGHYEVRTHSPMLAELLNPKGSHGQGAVFLQHFLALLKIQDFDVTSAHVDTEVYIGELGQLDIEIKDGNRRSIFIENKIHARLQENQLGRYHQHNPIANLLFLTLNDEPPSDWLTNPVYKTESFKRVFNPVSYRTEIVKWLEASRCQAGVSPHYLHFFYSNRDCIMRHSCQWKEAASLRIQPASSALSIILPSMILPASLIHYSKFTIFSQPELDKN